MDHKKLDCKGCKGGGRHLFSQDGYCSCPAGRVAKQKHDDRVDRYLGELGKGAAAYGGKAAVRV